jgi:hypothetical protein
MELVSDVSKTLSVSIVRGSHQLMVTETERASEMSDTNFTFTQLLDHEELIPNLFWLFIQFTGILCSFNAHTEWKFYLLGYNVV